MAEPTIRQRRKALDLATDLRLFLLERSRVRFGNEPSFIKARCERLIHKAANQIQREFGFSPTHKQDLIKAWLRDVGSASQREICEHFEWSQQDVSELVKHPQIEEYMPEPAGNGSKRGRLAKRYRVKSGEFYTPKN